MRTHDGAVDHGILVVGIGRQMLEDPLPHAVFRPTAEAPMHVFAVTETVRQVTPRDPSAIAVEHSFNEQSVVHRGHAHPSGLARQQRLDPVPLVITQPITMHRSAPKADRLGIEECRALESAIDSAAMLSAQMLQIRLTKQPEAPLYLTTRPSLAFVLLTLP
jgi:hypothetical protein